MALQEPKRTLCSCREAAAVLGCTMGRVRQLCRRPSPRRPAVLWSAKMGARLLVLDLDQVRALATARALARAAHTVRGARPKGFSPDV